MTRILLTNRKVVCLLVLAVGFFSAMGSVWGQDNLTGMDFMQAGFTKQGEMLRPYPVKFLKDGYKNIPAVGKLIYQVEKLIRQNGLADEPLSQIALEAALAAGMIKK